MLWHSSNALSQNNEVTQRQARLVPGRVTVHGTKTS